MRKFNFDQVIDRTGTESVKYEGRKETFGTSDVIPLWVADTDFAVAPGITHALRERIQHPIYGYAQVPEKLYSASIDWMWRRHQWKVRREEIILSPGVVPAFYMAVRALTLPGDSVIVQPPVYNPFFTAVTHASRKLLMNPLRLKGQRYEIDFEHFEQCARQSKLFLFCSPHNPVGRVWTEEELKKLLQIARQYHLTIFSDEIHADLIFKETKHYVLASLADEGDRIVTAISPSKTFNIPGLSMATVMAPNSEIRALLEFEFQGFPIKSYNPLSMAAFMSAYNEGEHWLTELMEYLLQSKTKVSEFINKHLPKIKVVPSEGTYLLWLDCRDMQLDDRQLHSFFIHDAGVGLSPGTLFGEEGRGFMRMNLGAPYSVLEQALVRIQGAYTHRSF